MRLRSRGLGRKELVMDFREYKIVREGEELVVVGTIRDPVNWDFTIRVCEDDIIGMRRLMFSPRSLGLLVRFAINALFRKPHAHWGQDRSEHLEEGRKRLIAAKEVAQERAQVAMKPIPAPARRATRAPRAEKVTPLAAVDATAEA